MNTQLIKELEEDLKELKKEPMANSEAIERIGRKIKGLKENIELTEDQILNDIEPFKHDWINELDWWFGSTTAYANAPLGYDINIVYSEETLKTEAIVYALKPCKEDKGHLEISEETLIKFEIKSDYPIYEQGNILECIFEEIDSPFEAGINYLVTKVSEIERANITLKVYTLNDRCDFKYTNHEISAYFKKAVLSC